MGFVQKTSALVDAEGFKAAATIHNLRNELPENVICL